MKTPHMVSCTTHSRLFHSISVSQILRSCHFSTSCLSYHHNSLAISTNSLLMLHISSTLDKIQFYFSILCNLSSPLFLCLRIFITTFINMATYIPSFACNQVFRLYYTCCQAITLILSTPFECTSYHELPNPIL